MKRSRRGGRRPQNGNGGNGGGSSSNSSGGHNPNRTYDSSGPEVKIRGSASHVYEKYLQLARDANASGDRIMAENYLQHAEHYYRIMAVAQAQAVQYQQSQNANGNVANGSPNANNSQSRPPTGTEEQPFIQPSGQQTSTPSFSLTENQDSDGNTDDDDEEGEEGDSQE